MMTEMDLISQQAESDYSKARTKALFRHIFNLIMGKPTLLLPFNKVYEQLNIKSQTYKGFKSVSLENIIGSVDRYNDFDSAFLPVDDFMEGRWKRINRAYRKNINLPPVSLYKIGDIYFVQDGNHRISVARRMGVEFIDAEVIEFQTNVKIDKRTDLKKLIIKSEYSDFLANSELEHYPLDSEIEFSKPGRYQVLWQHIEVHRYFKGIDKKREISIKEAAISWYENLYFPMVAIFRRHDVLKKFPNRTEADLYLWMTNHRYFLMEKYGENIDVEHAVLDFTKKYKLTRVDIFLNAIGLKGNA